MENRSKKGRRTHGPSNILTTEEIDNRITEKRISSKEGESGAFVGEKAVREREKTKKRQTKRDSCQRATNSKREEQTRSQLFGTGFKKGK
jgi:hypothetical protein